MRRKFTLSVMLSLLILLLSYLLGNTSFPLPNELGVLQKINSLKLLMGSQIGNVPDSMLFINVCYDKQLVNYEEDDMHVGQYVITDRDKLLRLLTIAREADNYRYLFLDVVFEKGLVSPADSALFHLIASMDRVLIPVHHSVSLQDSILYPKAANADYTITWDDTSFARYRFLNHGEPAVPLKMYMDRRHIDGSGITPHLGGLWYTDQGRLCHNEITLLMHVRMTGKLMDTEGQVRERNYIYMGADLLDIDSVISVKEQLKDKIVIIGDFRDDMHDTYLGPQPGSVICMNAYVALMNGDHLVNWWCVLLLFCIYTIVGLSYLTGYSLTALVRPIWLKVIVSFISTTIFFMMIAAIAYLFDIAFNIWVPTIAYSLLDTILQKYNTYKGENV